MTLRTIRLNKLVCRELNSLIHTLFRDQLKNVSITEAKVSPDTHDAYIYFSVVGDEKCVADVEKFLDKKSGILRRKLSEKVQLKFSPKLHFRYDDSGAKGQRILQILDEL